MKKPRWFSIVSTLSLLFVLFVSHETPWLRATASNNEIANRYGQLPLRFEVNAGQVVPATRFVARGARYAVALQPQRALVQLPATNERAASMLEMHWLNANPQPVITGIDELATRTNYLRGARRQQSHTDIHNYGSVVYEKVYPGIDLVWYGNQQQLEYDFRLAPHARPDQIRLAWRGADCVRLETSGDLVIAAQGRTLRMRKPIAWQTIQGERRTVACDYRLEGAQGVTFAVGAYDATQPLVIDPMLLYAFPVNGNQSESPAAVAVDAAGNAYLTGHTDSINLASDNVPQPNYGGGFTDAFVAKLDSRGTQVLYATYLGGKLSDYGTGIAVDAQGNAYVTGTTESSDFPTTTGALQTTKRAGYDAFVVKLNATGDRLSYATFLGGENADNASDIAVNAAGQATIVGNTNSYQLRQGRENIGGLDQNKAGVPLWQSTDRGTTLTPRAQGLTAVSVATLAVHPQNQQHVLLSAEEGLFRTLDAGATWQVVANPDTVTPWPRYATELFFDPVNPQTVYALAFPGVYKSTDGGQTWTLKQTSVFGPWSDYTVLAISPTRPTTLYLGVDRVLWQSLDGGDTWQRRYEAWRDFGVTRIRSLAIHPTDNNLIFAVTNVGLYRSTNGGAQWERFGNGITQNDALTTIAIDPLMPTTLYLGGFRGVSVYKSVDAGLNWTPQTAGLEGNTAGVVPVSKLLIEPANRNTIYALSQTNQLYRSLNGGAQWNRIISEVENMTVAALAVDRNNPGKLYVSTQSGADGFAAQLDADGASLRWLSYLGGTGHEVITANALDPAGNVYLTGLTGSRDFTGLTKLPQGADDGFFALKLAADGSSLLYASQWARGYPSDLALSVTGQAVIAGYTSFDNLPTVNPIQATRAGGTDGGSIRLARRWTLRRISAAAKMISCVGSRSPTTARSSRSVPQSPPISPYATRSRPLGRWKAAMLSARVCNQ